MKMTAQMCQQEKVCRAKLAAVEAEREIESIVSSRGGMGMKGLKLFRGIIERAIKQARKRK